MRFRLLPLRWPALSIRNAVVLSIAAAVLIPTLALWSVAQEITRRAQEPLIEQGRNSLLVVTASALVEPLWTLDRVRIDRIMKRLIDDPSVLSLRLTERRPLVEPIILTRRSASSQRGEALKTSVTHEGLELAELEVWFDPAQIDNMLAERRMATIQLTTLQILLSVLVLMAVLYRRLLAPIQRLKQQASEIASRAEVEPVRWDRRDELGQLGEHLNEVHTQIDALFEQLETQTSALEKLALHDALTGLPNRTLFSELVHAATASAARHGTRLALLFIDLDRFKIVNDTLGHAAGDTLLVTLAQRLRSTLRAADVVCRHSGDEFTVLLHDANHVDDVVTTIDRLLKEIERPVQIKGREVAVSASVGVALFPDDAADPQTLLRHADTAMYAAKKLGRARYSFFRIEFNSQLQATQQLEHELQYALTHGEFVLYYQPQVDAATGELLGCEALIRWMHPQRGMVPPLEFIGAAEQCGLISDLGAWTIRTACAQIAQWKAADIHFGSVAVNVSALEFRSHRLLDTLTSALTEFGVLPHELEIELTESVLMTDTASTKRIIDGIHQLGLPLAVDDFGTGYSSLAYLKHLRPSKIKIDRSFIKDLPGDQDDLVLVGAIVQLAHALGVRVVAEGVETAAQRAFLVSIGCGILQGYLISRPQPAPKFEEFTRQPG